MGSQGATCFHTLTQEHRDIPPAQWEDERFGMVCGKASNFADMKKWIEQLCSYSNDCDYAQKEQVKAFFERIDRIQSRQ